MPLIGERSPVGLEEEEGRGRSEVQCELIWGAEEVVLGVLEVGCEGVCEEGATAEVVRGTVSIAGPSDSKSLSGALVATSESAMIAMLVFCCDCAGGDSS